MNRRDIFKAAPAAAALFAMPALAKGETDRERMIAVIEQLEAYQYWEPSSTVAAKAFAAWQMRKALGLELPDPKNPQMHIDYQRQGIEQYKRSYWYERDLAEGKPCEIAAMERKLA